MKEAVRLYRFATERGHAIAQKNLGACYTEGEGVERDDQEDARWYRLGAELDHEDSKEALERLLQEEVQS